MLLQGDNDATGGRLSLLCGASKRRLEGSCRAPHVCIIALIAILAIHFLQLCIYIFGSLHERCRH